MEDTICSCGMIPQKPKQRDKIARYPCCAQRKSSYETANVASIVKANMSDSQNHKSNVMIKCTIW